MRSSEKGTLYPKLLVEPARSAPAAVQLLPPTWGYFQNQALASSEFPNEDADRVESAWSSGSGARSRVLHVL